ncbi:hypothetical protein [Lactococcus phage P087]|uniref:Uncharacterized protein n=1 Tax=Lactococcus phage P087 TaxID=641487 RepID=C3U2J7_9CAUD|nr:hypothetical protein P087_gp07 [Lactococcus phage P087]ACP41683.1 hypothetical protein [Lactococcus phage P087]
MTYINNEIEVREDGKHTTVRVNGVYWGFDPIDNRPWQVSEFDLSLNSIDDLIEMVTLITGSVEVTKLVDKLKEFYPDFPVITYKS